MRQRTKAPELWMLLPILLIMAAALGWGQLEKVSAPGGSRMFVEDYRFEPASGRWQERGYSHRVTVTVAHPWPQPDWWGQEEGLRSGLDPLAPVPLLVPKIGDSERDYLRAGGALTIEQHARQSRLSAKPSRVETSEFRDGKYFFVHYVNATYNAQQSEGVLRFRGLYKVGAQPAFAVSRVVRAQGETLQIFRDRRPGARLLFIDALGGDSSPTEATVFAMLRRDKGAGRDARNCPIYDFTIVDGTGQSHALAGSGVSVKVPPMDEEFHRDKETKMNADQFLRYFMVQVSPNSRLAPPLKLRGKISVDEAWPIPFEVELPRPKAPKK